MTDNLGNTPVSNTSYNVFGLPTGLTLGSGDSDAYGYDPNTGRMTSYQFNVNGQSMVGNTTWNANGTLNQLAITDPFNSSNQQTCNYVYDDLARAASVNCKLNPSGTPNWTQTFSFDAFGNIDKTGSNGGTSFLPTYTSNPPTNRYASLPSGTPSYDANGNVLADGFHNYTWDADGNSVTMSDDPTTITFDALGRIAEEYSGGYAQFVYGPDGSKLSMMFRQTLAREQVPMPGGGEALYSNYTPPLALVNYLHANGQGSTPLGTVPNRTIAMDGAFAPYGEPFAGNPFGDFTGQVNDTQNDLYDFLYREYQLTQGRWVSPDPAGLAAVNPANPQSWNRYAYVTNNPLALIDPLGLGDCGGDTNKPCNDPVTGCTWDPGSNTLKCPGEGGPGGGGGGGGGVLQPGGCAEIIVDGVDTGNTCGGQGGSGNSGTTPRGGGAGTGGAANNGTQKPCPAVPAHPANANVNSNIATTNFVYYANWLNPPTQAAFTDAWLVSQVRPNGPWDYKTQGQQYDAFGNFNFGATGGAAGIPLQVLQAGAGAVSTLVGTNSSQYGSWYQPPLYGHAPAKSDMIAAGYAYYQQGCK